MGLCSKNRTKWRTITQRALKGYSQIAEIDYHETFAPKARMSSVRMLMQRAVQNNMIIHQMEVKMAYLNAPIDCDIYLEQPEGFKKVGKNSEKLVCKLKKSQTKWEKLE